MSIFILYLTPNQAAYLRFPFKAIHLRILVQLHGFWTLFYRVNCCLYSNLSDFIIVLHANNYYYSHFIIFFFSHSIVWMIAKHTMMMGSYAKIRHRKKVTMKPTLWMKPTQSDDQIVEYINTVNWYAFNHHVVNNIDTKYKKLQQKSTKNVKFTNLLPYQLFGFCVPWNLSMKMINTTDGGYCDILFAQNYQISDSFFSHLTINGSIDTYKVTRSHSAIIFLFF